MALIPTVFVSIVVKDQVGEPVRGAVVEAKLTTVDRWQGYIVPKSYKGFTGADGICRLAVFPNELGTEGSEYLFDIKLPDGTGFNALATVPNRDCHLHDITELEPYEPRGTGAVITSEVAAYADTAAKASSDALKPACTPWTLYLTKTTRKVSARQSTTLNRPSRLQRLLLTGRRVKTVLVSKGRSLRNAGPNP